MHHHKELKPIETITNIRSILSDISILPTEKWHNYVDGLYSLRLTLPEITSNIGVNGKGISKELALASAYGELMERLQNQLLYPLFMYYDFDDELKEMEGFEFDPNEKKLSTTKILNNIPEDIINALSGDIEIFKKSFSEKGVNEIVCLPYYHYNSGETIYFPKDSFFYYYGSNGMAAGNTLEEAIVQGLSEIYERHVMRAALYDEVSFPQINHDILKQHFVDEHNIIREIESSTNFKIRVLDCTMGCRFPVIGIIVTNNETHKHFVRFGSHPDLHIALERCLTELLQGRNISDLNNMIDFKFLTDIQDGKENINFHNIFRDGWGYYPNSFFLKKSEFSIDTNYIGKKYDSNRESLEALLKPIKDQKWHLLIRDVGFLGFPAVSICIPGISEVSKIDEQNIYSLNEARNTAIMLRRIHLLDDKEKNKILTMSEYQGMMEIKPDLIKLVNLPIDMTHPYSKVNTSLLSALLHRSMGDFKNAISCIDDYLQHMDEELSLDAKSYFRCARNYLIMLQEPGESKDAKEILTMFFKTETVDKVLKEFSTPDYLLKDIGVMKCPNCNMCPVNSCCSYTTIRNVHRILKRKMKENPIDQNRISEVFV